MGIIKPYDAGADPYNWTCWMLHWGAFTPNDSTSYHGFGYCQSIDTPLGVVTQLDAPSETAARAASLALHAIHHAADQTCSWCRAFAYGPALPRVGGIRTSRTPYQVGSVYPQTLAYPPAVYLGKTTYLIPPDLTFEWDSPAIAKTPPSYHGDRP